jgi:uncharacterized DUF497 family protein
MADGFERDAKKAAANLAKHGIDFIDAQQVFEDHNSVEWIDDRRDYGETRWIVLGMVNGRLLNVVYTAPDETTVRIISARGATPRERRKYHEGQT